ncbi:MAG: hypothetical protein H8E90_08990, partial [Anaerolineales bacterium]|nr:hypothetical protein [Anaerolineales bacterium]
GAFQNFENFADIHGSTIGGVNVSVVNGLGNDQGMLTLSGTINSFAIGGQELWIDDVCPPEVSEESEVLNFSVRPGATGRPGTAVEAEAACDPAEVAGDEFAVTVPGQNEQVLDEDGIACSTNAGYPFGLTLQDDLDALSGQPPAHVDEDGDGIPDEPVYFSLTPGSPSLTPVSSALQLLQVACVDFEDLTLGTVYNVGDTFVTSGITVTATAFQWSGGTWTSDGFAEVENTGLAGGTGQEMEVNNITLEFDFGDPISGLELLFGEYGGNLNIEINGAFQNFENFADIDGSTIGGVSVSVVNGFGNDQGTLTLSGTIYSFTIGGQELWIDDVCPESAAEVTAAHILVSQGGGPPVVFATPEQLGLQAGDDVDAIALVENGNGYFDPASEAYPDGDRLVFSLAAGSPTLNDLGRSSAALFVPNKGTPGGHPVVAFPALLSGLAFEDDLNALKGDAYFLWRLAPFPEEPPTPEPSGCEVNPIGGPEGWNSRTSLPVGREGGFAVIIGNRIYVGQGLSAFGDDSFHFIYHIPTDTWHWAAPAPIGRAEVTGVCAEEEEQGQVQGKVFVFGGRSGGAVLDNVLVYDPLTDSWSARAPMPTPRVGMGAAWVPPQNPGDPSLIYVIGGRDGTIPHSGTPLDVVEAYDVNTGIWSTMAPLPIPMMDVYSTVYYSDTHKIFVIGGYDGTNVSDVVQIYDVASDSWTMGASMPTPRSNLLAGLCEGRIHAIGGYDGTNEFAVNEAYDPATNTWSTAGISPLPEPRSEFMTQGIFTGQDIYAIGDGIHGVGGAPHDVYTCGTTEPPVIEVEIPLQIGWNHISLPLAPLTPYTAEGVCTEINSQGGDVAEIDRWYASGWAGHICGLPFNDFDVELGSDYFIRSDAVSIWTIEGYEVTTGVPLELQVGWNSIGIPHTDAYTAQSLCDEINGHCGAGTAVEVDRWYASGWDGHICGLPFNDFAIEIGKGYFVKASGACTVTPSLAATSSTAASPRTVDTGDLGPAVLLTLVRQRRPYLPLVVKE